MPNAHELIWNIFQDRKLNSECNKGEMVRNTEYINCSTWKWTSQIFTLPLSTIPTSPFLHQNEFDCSLFQCHCYYAGIIYFI